MYNTFRSNFFFLFIMSRVVTNLRPLLNRLKIFGNFDYSYITFNDDKSRKCAFPVIRDLVREYTQVLLTILVLVEEADVVAEVGTVNIGLYYLLLQIRRLQGRQSTSVEPAL